MKRYATLIIGLLTMTALAGCENSDKAGNMLTSLLNEVGEAYENVTEKINTTKNWFTKKVDQVDQAASDLGEAADSIGDAVTSIKELSDLKEKSPEPATTAEPEPATAEPAPTTHEPPSAEPAE